MEIITGYVGKKHVTSEQERDVNQGIVGPGSYVLKTGMQMEAEVSSNNEIKIRDGVLMHQGCAASIKKNTYDSLTIINGSQGMKRIDLIVARYEKNRDDETESLNLEVIQGTPAESNPAVPEYTEGSIQAGDYIADMPMYQVIINGLNITEVKRLFEVEPDIDTLKKEFAELNGKIPFPTVLYDNASGAKTDVTLSDDISNYEYIEIFYGNDLNNNDTYIPMCSVKTMLKDGYARARLLWFGSTSDSATHQFSRLALELHDNTIHFGGENFVNFSSTAGSVKWSNASTKHFKVFRVIGWKH